MRGVLSVCDELSDAMHAGPVADLEQSISRLQSSLGMRSQLKGSHSEHQVLTCADGEAEERKSWALELRGVAKQLRLARYNAIGDTGLALSVTVGCANNRRKPLVTPRHF